MSLPSSIQRQADEAAAAEQTLLQAANTPNPVVENVAQLFQPAPVDSATKQPNPPATPPAPTEDFQQKYRSLQGLFAQKTAELQTLAKTQESQIAAMQRQLAELTAQKEAKPAEKKAADPKDVENFGADMIEMVQRYAEQVFKGVVDQFGNKAAELDARITGLEQQITGVSNKADSTLEQQFYAALGGLVPDWEQINTDSRWLQWLAEVDPVYGATRQAALDAAHKELDVQRVSKVFRAFRASNPGRPPESLANQVAPTGAANPPPAAGPAKPILSAKSVEKFYKDLAQGRVYAGREAEAAQIVAEIDLAAAEGRIR